MISFIIPTLNEEKTIENTLRCLDAFSGEKEIIVSDGGSKDKTIEIASKYTNKIVIHKDSKRQNIAQGRNAGARRRCPGSLLRQPGFCGRKSRPA